MHIYLLLDRFYFFFNLENTNRMHLIAFLNIIQVWLRIKWHVKCFAHDAGSTGRLATLSLAFGLPGNGCGSEKKVIEEFIKCLF